MCSTPPKWGKGGSPLPGGACDEVRIFYMQRPKRSGLTRSEQVKPHIPMGKVRVEGTPETGSMVVPIDLIYS